MEFTEKAFGNDSPDVAGALNSPGTLYRATADYAKVKHPDVVIPLSDMTEAGWQ